MSIVEQNAVAFINAYQSRHHAMVMSSVWFGRHNMGAVTEAYWKWRGEWITLCLRMCEDYAREVPTMQVGGCGYVAVGDEHVKSAHPLF